MQKFFINNTKHTDFIKIKSISAYFNCLKDTDSIKTHDGNEKVCFGEYVDDNKFQQSFDRIVCVAYDGDRLEYDRLSELINNRK